MTIVLVTFFALLSMIGGALYLVMHDHWLALILSGLTGTALAVVFGMWEVRKLNN